MYEKFSRVPAQSVEAGDICAVCGIDDIQVIMFFPIYITSKRYFDFYKSH